MREQGSEELRDFGTKVLGCGEYLLFRHYFTVDQVKLHAASFCKKHLLCALCAIRRGAKALQAYLERWEVIRAEKPALRPFLVTLTVKDGPDLRERFRHLHKAQRELWKRKQRGRGCVLDGVAGAVWSYEIKRGKNSGEWHPHLHMVALAEVEPSQERLSREWHAITGDSFIVDVRPITGDPVEGFMEVFKYAVKFSDQEPADTVHAFQVLKGKRLMESAGAFRGVEVPESLTDQPLEGLPFVELFYRYLGNGYSLTSRESRAVPGGTRCAGGSGRAAAPSVEKESQMTSQQYDREPTPDEAAGMAWWNGMTEHWRGYWFEMARTNIPAEAWAHFKRARPEEAAVLLAGYGAEPHDKPSSD